MTIVGAVCGTVKNNFVLNMYLETFDKVCLFVVQISMNASRLKYVGHSPTAITLMDPFTARAKEITCPQQEPSYFNQTHGQLV